MVFQGSAKKCHDVLPTLLPSGCIKHKSVVLFRSSLSLSSDILKWHNRVHIAFIESLSAAAVTVIYML